MLEFKQLKKLAKAAGENQEGLRIALLGDTATQFLATAIKGETISRGIAVNLFEAEYNQVERQILDPTSDYYQFGAAFTIVFQSTHKLLEKYSLENDAQQWETLADERFSSIRTLCESAQGKIIYYNYPEIEDTVSALSQTS